MTRHAREILADLDDVELALHFGNGAAVPAWLAARVENGRRQLRLSELVGGGPEARRAALAESVPRGRPVAPGTFSLVPTREQLVAEDEQQAERGAA